MLTQAKAATETSEDAPSSAGLVQAPLDAWMSSRGLLTIAIAASCVLHAAAAAAMLISRNSDAQYGVLRQKVDALSLATSQSIVLESIVTEPVEAMASAAAAVPQGSVQSVDAEATPMEVDEPKPVVLEDPAPKEVKTAEFVPEAVETAEEPLDVIGGGADAVETVKAETVEEVVEEEPKPEEVTEVKKEKTAKEQHQSSQRQAAGGASARGENTDATAASGRVTASTGSILKYAARIRDQVARNRPPGRGRKGVAKVSFGLTTAGELTYVRVASSSGNPKLDEAAVIAVQRSAPFAPPPADASPDQLRFSIPFYFR